MNFDVPRVSDFAGFEPGLKFTFVPDVRTSSLEHREVRKSIDTLSLQKRVDELQD